MQESNEEKKMKIEITDAITNYRKRKYQAIYESLEKLPKGKAIVIDSPDNPASLRATVYSYLSHKNMSGQYAVIIKDNKVYIQHR
jgi:hypothetical protein